MIIRSPSFRMIASSPRNSNSRGIRTALIAAIPENLNVSLRAHCNLLSICLAVLDTANLSILNALGGNQLIVMVFSSRSLETPAGQC